MQRKQVYYARLGAWIGPVLLVLFGATPAARADVPWLAVRLAGGESAVFPVSDVERISFAADTLVVVHSGGAETYGAAAITRIEFLWTPANSSAGDPRDAAGLLRVVHLFQNQPNPFSPETRIAFDLSQAGSVQLMIYSANGRLIRRLAKDALEAGRHSMSWDGRDGAGKKVGGGVYFYQLTAPGVEESRRMILLP